MSFLRKEYDRARDLIQTETAKLSFVNFHYDIAKPEDFENFHSYFSLHQSARLKQFKVRQSVRTVFEINSIIAYITGIGYHNGFGYREMEDIYEKSEQFLISQHEKIF